MRVGLGCVAAVGFLSACVTAESPVQYGGIAEKMTKPAATTPCDAADIRLVREVEMVLPADSMPAFHTTSSLRTLKNISVEYDVAPDGRAKNIRYVGNPDDLKSEARRSLIRAMTAQVASFEYDWEGRPSYATACRYTVEVGA